MNCNKELHDELLDSGGIFCPFCNQNLDSKIGFLVDNNDDRLSWNDIEKVKSIFDEIEKMLLEINPRKWMINIDFLLNKIFNLLNVDVKIPILKFKKTIRKYNYDWIIIQFLIRDKIKSIINK